MASEIAYLFAASSTGNTCVIVPLQAPKTAYDVSTNDGSFLAKDHTSAVQQVTMGGGVAVGSDEEQFGDTPSNLPEGDYWLEFYDSSDNRLGRLEWHYGTKQVNTTKINGQSQPNPGTNGGLPTVDANNRVAGIQGTTNTLDELDAAQDFQHTTTRMAVAGIASEVWNEELAGNTDSGTIGGELLGAVGIGSKISSIQTAIGTPAGASVSADIASIKTDTGTTIPAAVAAVPGQVAADAAGILTDTNQERIPPSRVWKVVPTTDEGLVGESTKSVNLDSDPATFAVDFSEDIYANGVIAIVADPVIKEGTPGGVTFSSKGRLGAQARFQITLLTAGTYKIRVLVTYDNGSTANAEVTLRVVN